MSSLITDRLLSCGKAGQWLQTFIEDEYSVPWGNEVCILWPPFLQYAQTVSQFLLPPIDRFCLCDDHPSTQSAGVCDVTRGIGRSEHVKSKHEQLALFRQHTRPAINTALRIRAAFAQLSRFACHRCVTDTQSAAVEQRLELYIIFCGHNSQPTFLQREGGGGEM